MKAIAYSRVSTEDQASFGVSISTQEERILQYAGLYDIEIMEVIKDAGFSAKNMKRPGIQLVLGMMEKKEIEAVIVAKLDRLTRNIRDLADLVDLANKKGIALISVGEHIDTGSAAGRMMVNMIGTISQWEREVIGERTAVALRFKRSAGQRYNKNPLFGFQHDAGRLVPCDGEMVIIDEIISMHRAGFSYGKTARELNARQIQARDGGRWYAESVKRVIMRSGIRENILNAAHKAAA